MRQLQFVILEVQSSDCVVGLVVFVKVVLSCKLPHDVCCQKEENDLKKYVVLVYMQIDSMVMIDALHIDPLSWQELLKAG